LRELLGMSEFNVEYLPIGVSTSLVEKSGSNASFT